MDAEFINEVEAFLKDSFLNIDNNLLVKYYREVFNKEICLTCPDGFNDALIELKIWYKKLTNKVMANEKLSHKLLCVGPGETLHVKGYHKAITPENITQADIDFLIKTGRDKKYLEKITKEDKTK